MARTIVINLFGAPGAGKSTGAAYIFSKLKMAGINAELVTEYAKDKVWENNDEVFKNQVYLLGKQSFRLSRCKDKVDVIVTDSPLFLTILYNQELSENFDNLVMEIFNKYENFNYFLNRVKKYNPKGRFQTEEESDALSIKLKNLLNKHSIKYTEIPGTKEGYDKIVSDIYKVIN